jgi:hypothetical protein
VVAGSLLAMVLAGCSSGSASAPIAGSDGAASASGASAGAGASGQSGPGKASARAAQLLATAKLAAARAESVRVSGPLRIGSIEVTVDLAVGTSSASGTLRAGTGTAQARVISADLYLQGDAAFWNALVPGIGAQFQDRWVRVSANTAPEFAAVIGLVPVSAALDRLAPDGARQEIAGEKVNGADTVGLRGLGHVDTVYVSTAQPGYPLRVKPASGGSLTFAQWGGAASPAAGPTGVVIDATRFTLHG